MEQKIIKLIELCKWSFSINYNPHIDEHESVESYFKKLIDMGALDDGEIRAGVMALMTKRNTVFNIHCYPSNCVGHYSVYHYDLERCLDKAIESINESYDPCLDFPIRVIDQNDLSQLGLANTVDEAVALHEIRCKVVKKMSEDDWFIYEEVLRGMYKQIAVKKPEVVTQVKKFKFAGENVQVHITAPRILTHSVPDFFDMLMGPVLKANFSENQGENDERSVAPDAQ